MNRRRARRAIAPVSTGLAALAATLAPAAHATPAQAAETTSPQPLPDPGYFKHPVLTESYVRHDTPAGPVYHVVSGDTMSKVAVRFCGQANRWTGIYAASRAHHLTGPNANIIQVGQELDISCQYLPAELRYAITPVHLTSVVIQPARPASGVYDQKVWDVTYGYPNYCGDGDRDGWDVNCSTRESQAQAPTSGYAAPVVQSRRSVASTVPSTSGVNWNAIAACESGGNWSINTGNGFYGGLQFTQATWDAYGGGQYAPSANQASPSQQVEVATRVLAGQGIGAWPVCGSRG